MIRFTSLLLILLTLGVSTREWAIYSLFRINQDALAAAFCINQNQPELQCNGHCFLKEKLNADREETAPPAPLPQYEQEKNPVFYLSSAPALPTASTSTQRIPRFEAVLKASLFSNDCFRPPESLA